jgi:hypothetical protein
MLQVKYRNGLERAGKLRTLAEAATKKLEDIINEAIRPVREDTYELEWDQTKDGQNREVLVLRLSDDIGSTTATLTPEEIGNPDRLPSLMSRVWGDLHRVRTRKLLEGLWENRLSGK